MAYRERHKPMGEAQRPEPPIATETGGAERTETVTEERTRNERERRRKNSAKSDEQTNANTVPRPPRFAFVEQLRKQQPESAAGYRLVLPARSPADTPKIVPVPDSQGGIRYWRLDPFEIPDDIRLQDGLSYRVLWVDAAGQPLAPMTSYVPRLYFFLGPPDSKQDERNAAYDAILRDVRDPAMRQSIEAEVARSRLALQREREREAIRQQQTEREEILYRIHTQQIEDDRRRRHEDRAEHERQLDKEKAEQKRQQAEQEAKNEREMWTAFKVMGGIAAAAAIGWGPFSRWLDSLHHKKNGDHENKQITEAVNNALAGIEKVLSQVAKPSDSNAALAADSRPEMKDREPGTQTKNEREYTSEAATMEKGELGTNRPQQNNTHPPSQTVESPVIAKKETEAQNSHVDCREETIPTLNEIAINQTEENSTKESIEPSDESEEDEIDFFSLLDNETIGKLCACVLDVDLMAQLIFEAKKQRAIQNGVELPREFDAQLNKEDMKQIHAIIANPIHVYAVLQICELLHRAKQGGAQAMFSLPPPMPSLTEQDRVAVHQNLATAEQKDYFKYLAKRRNARLQGLPMPPAQPLPLSLEEQKPIRRLSRDQRVVFYIEESGLVSGAAPQS